MADQISDEGAGLTHEGSCCFHSEVEAGRQEDFLRAYESIRLDVANGVKGHIVDQVCQSPDDPDSWLITSEWASLDEFLDWERTQEHQDMVKPMRDCWDEARSLKYVVREETGH